MKIELNKKHSIIDPFNVDLPDFTIMTGINGSGKTKILQAISSGVISVEDVGKSQIKYINHNSLSEQEVSGGQGGLIPPLPSSTKSRYSSFMMMNGRQGFPRHEDPDWPFFEKMAKHFGKEITELDDVDFENYESLDIGLNEHSIFYLNFYQLFYRYFERLNRFHYNNYLASLPQSTHLKLQEEEIFHRTHGEAPWDFANKIMNESNMDYIFVSPMGGVPSTNFTLNLRKISSGEIIPFSSMSSGEKVILSLVFAMYNSQRSIPFPKVLLLDEPDASLHPSMIKHFIKVIEEVFVGDKGIKVIMTTHSPTTVALVPEESIYTVTSPGVMIRKTKKDSALRVLTEGVPSLSIRYENRRQIFVEDPNDVRYYEKLYSLYDEWLIPEISLHFIAVGQVRKDKNGRPINGCDAVIDVIDKLVKAGSDTSYALVDGDNFRVDTEHVKALGGGSRHSTENYLLDPLIIAIYLLIEGKDDKITNTTIGLKKNENYIDIVNFDAERLQFIVDKVTSIVFPEDIGNRSMVASTLINGKVVQLPEFFMTYEGHPWEEALKKAFPSLKAPKDEAGLKDAVMDRVISIFPGLLPMEIVETLKKLQK